MKGSCPFPIWICSTRLFLDDFKPVPVQEVVDATGVTGPEGIPGEDGTDAEGLSVPCVEGPGIVPITDYSPDEQMMARFYHALAYEADERTVRIAVLGDSFIEADIITADMREQLQMAYGGSGVGFVPFSTPLSKYRGTVTHNHEGWTDYNLIKRKSVPEEYKEWFFVSGMLSIPGENASAEYKGVQFRRRIEKTNTASLLFRSTGNIQCWRLPSMATKGVIMPPIRANRCSGYSSAGPIFRSCG